MTQWAPESPWYAPADGPVDPSSAEIVADLVRRIRATQLGQIGGGLGDPVPVYSVDASVPDVPVLIDATYPNKWKAALAAEFARGVPIPVGARPGNAKDYWLVVERENADGSIEHWELEGAHDNGDGTWSGSWGAYIADTRLTIGWGRHEINRDGSLRMQPNWGVTASSAMLTGGVVTPDDVAAGECAHALALVVGDARAMWRARPAQRTDGDLKGVPAVVEGSCLRFPQDLDLSGLNPTAQFYGRAIQRFGMYPVDRTGSELKAGSNPGFTFRAIRADAGAYASLFPAGAHPLQDLPLERLEVVTMDLSTATDPHPFTVG